MITKTDIKTLANITSTDYDDLIDALITRCYEYIEGYLMLDIDASDNITETFSKKLNDRFWFTVFPVSSASVLTRESADILSDVFITQRTLDFQDEENTTNYTGDKKYLDYLITYTTETNIINALDQVAEDWVLYKLTRSSALAGDQFEMSRNFGRDISNRQMSIVEFNQYFDDRLGSLINGL